MYTIACTSRIAYAAGFIRSMARRRARLNTLFKYRNLFYENPRSLGYVMHLSRTLSDIFHRASGAIITERIDPNVMPTMHWTSVCVNFRHNVH